MILTNMVRSIRIRTSNIKNFTQTTCISEKSSPLSKREKTKLAHRLSSAPCRAECCRVPATRSCSIGKEGGAAYVGQHKLGILSFSLVRDKKYKSVFLLA